MSLFGGKKSYVGVDIGTSSIKVTEFTDDRGRPRLVTYGFADQPIEVLKSDTPESREYVTQSLKAILKKAHISSTQAVAALPNFSVFSSIISLPEMSKKDLFSAVRWEAKKFVPMPLEEMVLDWRVLKTEEQHAAAAKAALEPAMAGMPDTIPRPGIPSAAGAPESLFKASSQSEGEIKEEHKELGKEGQTGKNLRVLITAAPKGLVERYIQIFKGADLQMKSLETEAFSLTRSLIGSDPSPILLVDIGAVTTTISIIVDGIPMMNKSIDVGGETITQAITTSLHVEHRRAEQFKRDFGLATSSGPATQVPKTIEFTFSSIVNEMHYVLNLFQSQEHIVPEKIILAGGSAFLPNLIHHLETEMNMRAFIGDPWARVVYPKDLQPLLAEIGPRFAVAAGLGMREIL
ncbi:MAG: pilus assembly protein PilM [Patescibacteria group bacterium]|jgi:type IV pilus assembly protein PilM